MSSSNRFPLLPVAFLFATLSLPAQEKTAIPPDLPVDRVVVDGGELRGLVFGVGPKGEAWFACRRAWLRKNHPELAARLEKEQDDREWNLRSDYARRLAAWDKSLEASPGNKGLKEYIDQELSRMDPGLGAEGPAGRGPFVLARLDPARARMIIRARPEWMKLALVGWREEVDELENQSAAQTVAELKKDNIAWDKETPDFTEKMPGLPVESEADWELRKAFLSYARGSRLNFQGTGETIFETAEGAGALAGKELEQILGKLGPGILNGALGDLLGEGGPGAQADQRGVNQACRTAEGKNVSQFRLTRVRPDLANKRVTVEDRLYAKLPGPSGPEWRLIHSSDLQADATIARPQVEAQINKDPKAGPLLAQLRQLGLGDKLTEAIRFGAATLEAKEQADTAFNTVLRQYTRRVDGPPLRWLVPRSGNESPSRGTLP